ncbi:periplasmic/7TM domain sensor diguanylate cyclase [Christensenella hongkongensis]|nr:periplasmic/7TM domain sensor diguanylate cyclase [Christensenella hongkongensis]
MKAGLFYMMKPCKTKYNKIAFCVMKEYNYSIIDKGRYLRDWFVYGSCKNQETGLNCSKGIFHSKNCCRVFICLIVVCIFFAAFPKAVYANKNEYNTVRVGYPMQTGLTEIDENGNYSGYTYEYLQEMAQYNGWNFEFVTVEGTLDEQLTKLLDMLGKGEIDIMGGIVYSDELAQVYDYPGYSYGTAYSTLNVLQENTKINEANYQSIKDLKIALLSKAKNNNAALEQFCEMNGISPQITYCDDEQSMMEMLSNGTVDAVPGVDMSPMNGTRAIAKYSPKPYYFITTKGNSQLVNEISSAILRVNEADPYFSTTLYEKYFETKNDTLIFSDEEQAYIDQAGVIYVGVPLGRAPIQYMEENTGELKGISKDIFDHIAESTGLKFEFVPVGSYDELQQMMQEKKIDVIAGANYDYNAAEEQELSLTRPYLTSQIIMAVNKNVDSDHIKGKKLALPDGVVYEGKYASEVQRYRSPEDCLQAVAKGDADYTYGNGHIFQYYANQSQYGNLYLVPQSDLTEKVCIGVLKPADVSLLTIINKAVRNIPDETMNEIMNKNTVMQPEKITLTAFLDSNPREAVLSVSIFAAVIIVILIVYFNRRMKLSRKLMIENERYLQLAELSNEYIFEYDYTKDVLKLSEKCAKYFNVDRVTEHYSKTMEHLPKAQEMMCAFENGNKNEMVEDMEMMLPDGSKRWIRVTAKVISDFNGKHVLTVGKISDIQKEWEEKKDLLLKAQNDSLTNIYNGATCKKLINEHLQHSSEETPGALFVMDIDNFKRINDKYGHYTGDKVLINVADIIQRVFRKDDIVGRLGGDEFLAFMKNVRNRDMVVNKCEALRREIKKDIVLGQGEAATLSMGVAFAQKGQDYMMLYEKADTALYVVKEHGRNGFEIV